MSLGLTQQNVADKIGASHSFLVNRWERGIASPSPYYLQQLVNLFEKKPEELGYYVEDAEEVDTQLPQPPVSHPPYRSLLGFPPITDPRIIQQRARAVATVYDLLTHAETTAVVITGMSGIGKSTLAALVSNYIEEQLSSKKRLFRAPSLWLHIDESTTLTDIAFSICSALGVVIEEFSTFSLQQQALALFQILQTLEMPRLVVLNQFENLIDLQTGHPLEARPGISEWLDILNSQPCNSRVLLTSLRQPRGTHKVPDLYVKQFALEGLEANEALSLLRMHGMQAGKKELQEAVQRCDGHVYALVLLAALTKEYGIDLSQLLQEQTLWTDDIFTEFLSYIMEKLDGIHHALLHAFSVYREPVPLEAAQAILAATPQKYFFQAIRTLRAHHLLLDTGDGRFQLHAIVAGYARHRSNEYVEKEELATVEDLFKSSHIKAVHYYLQLVTGYQLQPRRRTIRSAYPLIEALWHLCQAQQWQKAYDLLSREALFSDLHLCGGDAALLEIYQLLLPPEAWAQDNTHIACIYQHLGEIHHALGNLKMAQEYYDKALDIYSSMGDQQNMCNMFIQIGITYDDVGNKQRAREAYETALRLSEDGHDPVGKGKALSSLGWVCLNTGQHEQAHGYLEEAISLFRSLKDLNDEAWTLSRLGSLYQSSRDYKQAYACYTQAVTIFSELGDLSGKAWLLGDLGEMYRNLGQSEEAITYLESARTLFHEVKGRRGEAWTLLRLATVYGDQNLQERALSSLESALQRFRELGDQIGEGIALKQLGWTYHQLQEKQLAREYSLQAWWLLREIGDHREEAYTLLNLGMVYQEQRNYAESCAMFILARRIFQKIQSPASADAEQRLEDLRAEIGEQFFSGLQKQVEQHVVHLVEQALRVEEGN